MKMLEEPQPKCSRHFKPTDSSVALVYRFSLAFSAILPAAV